MAPPIPLADGAGSDPAAPLETLAAAALAGDAAAAGQLWTAVRGRLLRMCLALGTPPVLVERVNPQHPPSAKEAGRMGKVILEAVVDVEGRARAIKVLKTPSGGEDLVAAATAAIEKWRRKPAELHGKLVPVIFTVVVQFKLE